ncbi:UNVERIFIED_ORG: integration host factor subunit alpha [Herbaspirillum seropedicae]|jgi:integration host factor subunit alpha
MSESENNYRPESVEAQSFIAMNNVNSNEFQSVLDADLHRAVLESQARSQADKNLPTLTKAELAELLFEQVGLNKREAKDMVETFFDEIRNALERGEAVKLSGFGNFQLRDKPQRPGRNPKTGEEIPITARRVVTFHASQKLKEMVELSSGDAVEMSV